MLKELLNAKSVSIYCIVNEVDKKIYITYAIETITSILYNIGKFKESLVSDKEKVEFRIIETYDRKNTLYLKWRVQELYEEYKNLGYTFYTSYKPLQWKLYVRVGQCIGSDGTTQYKAIVKLKTSANFTYNVLQFDTVQEADEFVQGNTISTTVRLL